MNWLQDFINKLLGRTGEEEEYAPKMEAEWQMWILEADKLDSRDQQNQLTIRKQKELLRRTAVKILELQKRLKYSKHVPDRRMLQEEIEDELKYLAQEKKRLGQFENIEKDITLRKKRWARKRINHLRELREKEYGQPIITNREITQLVGDIDDLPGDSPLADFFKGEPR